MKTIKKTPKKTEKVIVIEDSEEVIEVDGGFDYLLGKTVCIITSGYIWTGILSGINATFFELTDPHIIYETGPWNDKMWKDVQKLPTDKARVFFEQLEGIFEVLKK
jgi:hypothetical protein